MAENLEAVRIRGSKGSKMTMLERSLAVAQGMRSSGNAKSSFALFLAGALRSLRKYLVETVDLQGPKVRSINLQRFFETCLLMQKFRELGRRYETFNSTGMVYSNFSTAQSRTQR